MQSECRADLFGFAPVDGRRVEASFDAGMMTSDAGALLLGANDRAIGLIDRLEYDSDYLRNRRSISLTSSMSCKRKISPTGTMSLSTSRMPPSARMRR